MSKGAEYHIARKKIDDSIKDLNPKLAIRILEDIIKEKYHEDKTKQLR